MLKENSNKYAPNTLKYVVTLILIFLSMLLSWFLCGLVGYRIAEKQLTEKQNIEQEK